MIKPIKYVYVAGPLTGSGRLTDNVRNACDMATILLNHNFVPFVPHVNVWWALLDARSEKEWLKWDLEWLRRSDAVLRLPGTSPGSDIEEGVAKELGLPIFYHLVDLLKYDLKQKGLIE